jgi:tetratricopeptide (TPR) repeat protein
MKTLISFLAFICFAPIIILAQDKVEKAFEAAGELYEEKKFAESALAYLRIMKDYPDHELKPRAHFNLAICYRELQDTVNAKRTFLEIVDEDYNEHDANDIMEPYALYKHHACRNLASIALAEKNYEEAEKYIHFFDKRYPYQHFCGNEWAAYHIFKDVMLAQVYEGQHKPAEAVKALAPHLFYNGLAGNGYALELLSGILERNFTGSEVKAMFQDAYNSLSIKKVKRDEVAELAFYGVTITLDEYFLDERKKNEDLLTAYQRMVRTHELFLKYL